MDRCLSLSPWAGVVPGRAQQHASRSGRVLRALPAVPGPPVAFQAVFLKRSMLSLLCFQGFGSVKLILIP